MGWGFPCTKRYVMSEGRVEREKGWEGLFWLTLLISHNRIDLSSEPEASVFESGLHAIADIPAR